MSNTSGDTDDDDDVLVLEMSKVRVSEENSVSAARAHADHCTASAPTESLASTLQVGETFTLAPPTLKPLRPYQSQIICEIQSMFVSLQSSRKRSGPSPPVHCNAFSVGDCSIYPATAEGWASALRASQVATPVSNSSGCLPGSTLLYLPTGGGKTRIAGELCRFVSKGGGRVLFVVNRTKLVTQAADALCALGLRESLCVWGEKGCDESRAVHVATIQSLAARLRRDRGCETEASGAGGEVSGVGCASVCEKGGGSFADAAIPSKSMSPPTPGNIKFDLLVLDEAHGSVSASYRPLWNAVRARSAASLSPSPCGTGQEHRRPFVVGLTATPLRHGDRLSLGNFYDSLIVGPSLSQLVALKVLVQPVAISCDLPELSACLKKARTSIETHRQPINSATSRAKPQRSPTHHLSFPSPDDAPGEDDFEDFEGEEESWGGAAEAEALEEALRVGGVLSSLVKVWKGRCQMQAGGQTSYRPTIVFAPSVSSSEAVARAFREAGIAAAHVDGGMSVSSREAIYEDMRNGTCLLLSSVGVVSEGYDEPTVSALVLLRPTASRGLYIQQVGRGLRGGPAGKTNCLVLDFVQATLRHGPVTTPLLEVLGVGEGLDSSVQSQGPPISYASTRDEAEVARDSLAAKLSSQPSLRGAQYQKALADEASKARIAAIRSGGERVWICPTADCASINHIMLDNCSGCARRRPVPKKGGSSVCDIGGLKMGSGECGPGAAQSKAPELRQATLMGSFIPRKTATHPAGSIINTAPPFDAPALVNNVLSSASHSPDVGPAGLKTLEEGLEKLSLEHPFCVTGKPNVSPASVPPTVPLAVPDPHLFTSQAFRAACNKLGLPEFHLGFARNSWEKEFLRSLAAFITPGAVHPFKTGTNLAGRTPSEKQRDILMRIAAKK